MPILLRYRYAPGERFAYVTQSHTDALDPGSATRGRKSESLDFAWRSDLEVTRADADFAFHMVVSGQIGSEARSCSFAHDALGKVSSEPQDLEQYQRPLLLPEQSLEVGESWTDSGMEITLEAVEGDRATLVLTCELDLPGKDVDALVESTIVFSLGQGRPLESRSVTIITFEGGRSVKTTATTRLV